MISAFLMKSEAVDSAVELYNHYFSVGESFIDPKALELSLVEGEALEGDIRVLDCLYRLGVRSIGLTWNQRKNYRWSWQRDTKRWTYQVW